MKNSYADKLHHPCDACANENMASVGANYSSIMESPGSSVKQTPSLRELLEEETAHLCTAMDLLSHLEMTLEPICQPMNSGAMAGGETPEPDMSRPDEQVRRLIGYTLNITSRLRTLESRINL